MPGWLAITWLLAESRIEGVTAKADLEALLQARSEVLGLNVIGELTDFYQNTLAAAGLIGLSPQMTIHVVSQAISQGIQVSPMVANAVKTDAKADDLNIVVREWSSVVRGLAEGGVDIGTPLARLGVSAEARSGSIALSPNAIGAFPPSGPLSQEITATGIYTIPYWSRYIDLIGKGAGRGGRGGGLVLRGDGGGDGYWGSRTIERGVHIPWSTAFLEIIVANGSSGSPGEAVTSNPSVPGPTNVISSGTTLLSVAGGDYMQQGQNGSSGGSYEYRGITYHGGTGGRGNGGHGEAPGAGGAGGDGGLGFIPGSRGGDGARGQIWSVARQ